MEKLINNIYPCGMLDRDQRTILTISPPLIKTNKFLHNNKNDNYLNKFNYKYLKSDNNNDKNLIRNNKNNNFSLINNINYLKINNKIKYKNFNYNYKMKIFLTSKNKLKYLLVTFVFLILFQSAYSKPIHHHHIMDNNSEDTQDYNQISENNKKCQLIENVLKIANVGYSTIINEVNDYTRKTYSLEHLQHHREWIHHHNEALDPKDGRLKFENYNEVPPDEVVKHLYENDVPKEEKSINELLNIYERFKLILNAIQVIIKAKESDGNFNIEHGPAVMSFFKKQENIIIELLQEIEMGLNALNINLPDININIIEYKNDGFDWITIREYLKLLVYTKRAFTILLTLERCHQQ